ncbi:MFS transporter [Pseudochelatococcus sp. B33]
MSGLVSMPAHVEPKVADVAVYAGAQCVSFIGSWMQKAAVGWLMWELTHSPGWVGAIALTDLVSAIWVAPLAGTAADRSNPYRLILLTQWLSLVAAALLWLMIVGGAATPASLLLWAVIDSTVQGFNQPVRMLVIALIAPGNRTSQAIAANSIAANLARILGPAIGGFVMLHRGVDWAILLNILSFAPFLVAIVYLRRWIDRAPPAEERASLLEDIASGFSYVYKTPRIGLLFVLTALFALLGRPFTELFPAIAGEIFGGGPETLALLMSAQGVGALFGAGWMLRARSRTSLVVITFAAAFSIAVVLVGFSLWRATTFGLTMMLFAGFFHVVCNIGMQSMAQTMSELDMRGRVLSLYWLLFKSGPAVGAFLLGVGAHYVGLQTLIGLAAALLGVAVIAMAPSVRRIYLRDDG